MGPHTYRFDDEHALVVVGSRIASLMLLEKLRSGTTSDKISRIQGIGSLDREEVYAAMVPGPVIEDC